MNRRHMPWLAALAMVAIAGSAAAQTETQTRADAARAAREARAADPATGGPGRIERLLTTLESDAMFQKWLGPRDGFVVRLGGIEDGPGTAVGPAWRKSDLFGGLVQVSASAGASIGRDTEVEAAVALPRLASSRLAFRMEGSASTLANERFFGEGLDSLREHETAFGLSRRQLRATATVTVTEWLQLSGGAGLLRSSVTDGRSPRVPGITTQFTEADAPGLFAAPTFMVMSLGATADYRDVKGNPRRGGLYAVGVDRYVDRAAALHSFTRINVEVEQHVSAWKRQRTLTLRGIASLSAADAGHDVPFYLQRTLGGSRSLRGFVTDRFRDRQLMLLQAEYGWDLLPFLSAVLFVEGGAAAREWRDLSLDTMRRDYGIGFRFGSARTVALRTDVAFGSGEGTRFTMRFGHAF